MKRAKRQKTGKFVALRSNVNMEDQSINSPVVQTMETILKRHWKYFAAGAFLILFSSFLLLCYAISDKSVSADDPTGFAVPSSTELNDGLADRRLDGVRVFPDQADLLPYAVMVENHADARPLSGISKASLIFEAPVEGGITRMLAVYDASTTVDEIGPVRSARPYYVEWAQALEAVYAHVGGSPEALNRIGGLSGFRNLDEMAGEQYFWRSTARGAPHNTYTDSERLTHAAEQKSWSSGSFESWTFQDYDTDIASGDVTEIVVPFEGSYRVRWVYDSETDSYERYLGGVRQKDRDGTRVNAKNILVLQTDQRVLDDAGRLSVRTTGSGKGWLFHHGFAKEVSWSRRAGEFYVIETPDRRKVAFMRGNTWIEFASLASYEPQYHASSTDEEMR